LIIPVRCFTCGTLIGQKWEEFSKRVSSGEDAGTVLTSLGLKRPCCRRMLITNVDFIDELIESSTPSPPETAG
jgi:DNA-directed RNA polymerase subunit N